VANSIEIIINAHSGARRAQEMKVILERVLANSGRSYGISIAARRDLAGVIKEKAATDCEILVAAGGDGTIRGIAEAALARDKTLGVLPLGTFNYFARSLGIPLDLEAAARVILEGEKRPVSVFDLDGRLVLNSSSIGITPAVLSRRRKLYQRFGRSQLNTYLSVFLTAFQAPPRLQVRLATRDGEVVRQTPMVMVCSNAFQIESFALAGRECLEADQIAVYVARMAGRLTIFRLGLRTFMRRLRVGTDYEVICASDVTIERLRRRRFRVAIDGELERRESPLRFRINSKRLLVVAPWEESAV
jgi:diacylglycerol kinase family enzyme